MLRNRIDLFAVKTQYAGDGFVACVEVKTSLTDLRRDFMTDKNQYFIDHSDYFYYAVSRELIGDLKELTSKKFGILTWTKDGSAIRCARRPLINAERQNDFGLFSRAMRRLYNLDDWSYESQLDRLKSDLRKEITESVKKAYETDLKRERKEANLFRSLKRKISGYGGLWLLDDEAILKHVLRCVKILDSADALNQLDYSLEKRLEKFHDEIRTHIDLADKRVQANRQELEMFIESLRDKQ